MNQQSTLITQLEQSFAKCEEIMQTGHSQDASELNDYLREIFNENEEPEAVKEAFGIDVCAIANSRINNSQTAEKTVATLVDATTKMIDTACSQLGREQIFATEDKDIKNKRERADIH